LDFLARAFDPKIVSYMKKLDPYQIQLQ